MEPKLDPRKTYELLDFDDTSAAIDFLKANPGWDLYGQRSMNKFGECRAIVAEWTKTKLYREIAKE